MTNPALTTIGPDLRDLLTRLGQALTPTEALALRDRITDTLAGAGLAERVVVPQAPVPMTSDWPASEIVVDGHAGAAPHRPITAETVLTNAELRRLGGYRTGPSDGYGYDGAPIPGAE